MKKNITTILLASIILVAIIIIIVTKQPPPHPPDCSGIVRNEPISGRLKAIVELGSEGFNYFIVDIDGSKNWKLEKPEYGVGYLSEDLSNEESIKEDLKSKIRDIINYGVAGNDIHFIVSSGAQKESEKAQRVISSLESIGYKVNAVDYDKEAYYAYTTLVPEDMREESFVVDIGNGNTKVAWMEGREVKTLETYGAGYYKDGIPDIQVYQEVNKLATSLPAGRTKRCFIIGGVPFKMSQKTRIGNERFVCFEPRDYYDLQGEKNLSGLNIYKALSDGSGCETFAFDAEANFSIGFLLELPFN